jgi:hypothetical protein
MAEGQVQSPGASGGGRIVARLSDESGWRAELQELLARFGRLFARSEIEPALPP